MKTIILIIIIGISTCLRGISAQTENNFSHAETRSTDSIQWLTFDNAITNSFWSTIRTTYNISINMLIQQQTDANAWVITQNVSKFEQPNASIPDDGMKPLFFSGYGNETPLYRFLSFEKSRYPYGLRDEFSILIGSHANHVSSRLQEENLNSILVYPLRHTQNTTDSRLQEFRFGTPRNGVHCYDLWAPRVSFRFQP